MEEIWKKIEGTDREYAISNYGRVKSFNYKGHKGIERIIKGSTDKHGYLFCMFFTNGKPKRYSISREVAKAFIPNPENKPCVDHIDGNTKNNVVTNLRWCTNAENHRFPLTIERRKSTARKINGTPIIATKDGVSTRYGSISEFLELIGAKKTGTINDVLHKKRNHKTYKGYSLSLA